jgi:hypothetical protein
MGTSAAIAMQQEDGTIKAICVNYDGYLEGTYKALKEDYNTLEEVEALIGLGHLSTLCDEVIAYHRDQKESWFKNKPITYPDLNALHNDLYHTSYRYLFSDGEWQVIRKPS